MVVTQSLFQTKAGDGFRRFRLGAEGDWLRVDRVDDLAALKPFPGAASRTATIALTKGARTQYPVPYVKWTPQWKTGTVPICAPTNAGVGARLRAVPAKGDSPLFPRLPGEADRPPAARLAVVDLLTGGVGGTNIPTRCNGWAWGVGLRGPPGRQ